ncbi:MAG: hypothetical protein Q9219_005657 [cf. Caloplaca sp. 3 TL-2023]
MSRMSRRYVAYSMELYLQPFQDQLGVDIATWANDDLGVATEIDELEFLFQHMYQYRTDQWKIPDHRSHNALVRRIMQSLEDFESSDKLFIVYYGGHGYMNEDRQCVWLCIQTNLEEADSDVLILLDCCAAASSAGGYGHGITELIAACGFEDYAPGVGEHSFTRSLIEELRYYGQRPGPISTAFLHNKILARAKKSWNPRYVSDGTRERRKTPIHIHLADRSKQRCIELTPISQSPKLRDLIYQQGLEQPHALSSSPSEDVDMSDPNISSHTSLSEVWPDREHNSPKVLISVALEEDQFLRTEDILDWLKSFPAIARSVNIEGIHKSDSTLLLLSLPVAVWDMIPANPAITFVAFVRSRNLLYFHELEERRREQGLEEKLLQDFRGIERQQVAQKPLSSLAPRSSRHSPKVLQTKSMKSSNPTRISSLALNLAKVFSRISQTKSTESGKPTYIKVHRKHMSPETLEAYELPWEIDEFDSDYIIIKRWIDERKQDILFEHTRKLRASRTAHSSPAPGRRTTLISRSDAKDKRSQRSTRYEDRI